MESHLSNIQQIIEKLDQIFNYQIQDPNNNKVDEILKLLHRISIYQVQDPKDANIRQLVEQTQLIVERLNQLQQNVQTSQTGNVQTSQTGNVQTSQTGNVQTSQTGNVQTSQTGNVQTSQTGVITNTIKLNDMTHFLWFVVGGLMFLAALKIIVA